MDTIKITQYLEGFIMKMQKVKVELKHTTIEGYLVKIDGQNAYVKSGNDTLKFHIDQVTFVNDGERRQLVKIGSEVVSRLIRVATNGDRTIRYNNEQFLLAYHTNEVLHAVTSNLMSSLWERQRFVDSRMHHMDKIPAFTHYQVKCVLHAIIETYNDNVVFLDFWYDVDSYAMNQWIEYAKQTLPSYESVLN